jgi:glutamate synthase (NADPH/NADH) small chain
MPQPPATRAADNPWPQWPLVFRVSPAHEEGGERLYAVSTQRFSGDGDGHVRRLHAVQVELAKKDGPSTAPGAGRMEFVPVAGSEFEMAADLVLLAMGFTGPEKGPLVDDLGLALTDRGNVRRDERWMTNVPGVFTAGDMQRGQSLIVWAIAEGRSAARAIDEYLMGESQLPAPLQ